MKFCAKNIHIIVNIDFHCVVHSGINLATLYYHLYIYKYIYPCIETRCVNKNWSEIATKFIGIMFIYFTGILSLYNMMNNIRISK